MIATITYHEKELWVSTSEYSKEFVEWIKGDVAIGCRRWDPDAKAWVVSYSYEFDLIVECFLLSWQVNKIGKRPENLSSVKSPGQKSKGKTYSTPLDALTAYEVFYLKPNAPPEIIDSAYRAMCRLYHPDVYHGPDANDQMVKINNAYDRIRKVEKLER